MGGQEERKKMPMTEADYAALPPPPKGAVMGYVPLGNQNIDPIYVPPDMARREGGVKSVYDKPELENLLNALRRVGVFDLALPPEKFRPNPTTTYALPSAAAMYSMENPQL
jgi:hypothetical protein